MTYFSQQKKVLINQVNKNPSLGPGVYSPEQSATKAHSYAPFGSLQKKITFVNNSHKEVVGPGSYNINRDLIKPNVMTYENNNCVIIKINEEGSSQFKSQQQRFKEAPSMQTPGPGSYSSTLAEQKNQRKKRNKSVGSAINKMKVLYKNQYHEKRKPTLASDGPLVVEEEVKPKQQSKGILKWSLNKVQRFAPLEKQTFDEKDKSILLDKVNLEKRKQRIGKNESSFFASKSIKSSFDQMIYKSSNPFKVELRKMLGFEDTSPGPGTYSAEHLKTDRRPRKFQFFGSTVERFSNTSQQMNVGPGDYQIVSTNSAKKITRPKLLQKTSHRVITESQEQSIGPGCYQIQRNISSKHTHNRKYQSGCAQFGSKRPRFITEYADKKEERKQYISFMAQQDEYRKKRIEEEFNFRRNALKNKKSCVFQSSSKRFSTEESKKQDTIFGIYEVGIDDIGNRIRKQKQFFHQFHECNLTKPGFMSSVQRFTQQRQQQSTHKDCWCQIKQVEKKNIEHMSPAFQSNCLRTQVFESKPQAPPVGYYTKNTSFIKQSFNSRFIKQNQNKSKKIKVWKSKYD